MSPLVIGARSSSFRSPAKADKLPGKSPAPIEAAPAAIMLFLRNSRRFLPLFDTFTSFFMLLSSFQIGCSKRLNTQLRIGRQAGKTPRFVEVAGARILAFLR